MAGLTEEQKLRIEQNRQLALQKRSILSPDKTRHAAHAAHAAHDAHAAHAAAASTQSCDNQTLAAHSFVGNKTKEIQKYKTQKNQNETQKNQNFAINQKIKQYTDAPSTSSDLVNSYRKNVLNNPLKLDEVKKDVEFVKASKFLGKTPPYLKCSFELVDRERFKVTCDYCAPLVEVFKTMKTRNYDAVSKDWTFRLEEYNTLITKVSPMSNVVNIEALPKVITKVFQAQLSGRYEERCIPRADLSRILEKHVVTSLMPFQQEGVSFGVHCGGRVLLADDMGLGKTVQAICLAAYYREDWPVLVVTPSSLKYSWAEQFRRWLPTLRADDINVCVTTKDPCNGQVNIISYDLLARKSDELLKLKFNLVIVDESHFLKSSKTARTKAAMPILHQSRRVILLSGTPALSRPSELFTQIKAVNHRLFSNAHEFGLRYCNGQKTTWGWDYSGATHMNELSLLLEERIMIRRLKSDVIKQLPSKRREMVLLDPQTVARKHSNFKTSQQTFNKTSSKSAEQRGALLKYFQETAKVKVAGVTSYVLDLLEAGKKFLVFAHHSVMMNALEEEIQAKNFESIRIDGKTPAEQRKHLCDRFQCQDNVRVALLSISAASTGLNLTATSLVLFAELFWNPGILTQAEDRVHRIGQEDSVNIQYLVASNTADDYIWPMVQRKLDVLGQAGLSKDNFCDADTRYVASGNNSRRNTQLDLVSYFGLDTKSDCDDSGFSPGPDTKDDPDIPSSGDVLDDDWGDEDDDLFRLTNLGLLENLVNSPNIVQRDNNLGDTAVAIVKPVKTSDSNAFACVTDSSSDKFTLRRVKNEENSLWNMADQTEMSKLYSDTVTTSENVASSHKPNFIPSQTNDQPTSSFTESASDLNSSSDWLDAIDNEFSDVITAAEPDVKKRKVVRK